MNLLEGSGWSYRYARRAFPILVQWIEDAVNGGAPRRPFTYKELGSELGVYHRSVHWALGKIGHAIEEVEGISIKKWQTPIPPIELLICGQGSHIPGRGGLSFLSRYRQIPIQQLEKMPEAAKRDLVLYVHDQIYSFPHWREVLEMFALKPSSVQLPLLGATLAKIRSQTISGVGESEDHKKMKTYLHENPDAVGIKGHLYYRNTEETILSGDRLDVFLKSASCWFCVEVKPINFSESEIIRGLFQCVKYKAILVAQQMYERMQTQSTSSPEAIDVRLALGGPLPENLKPLRKRLGVNVIANVNVPKILAVSA